jgi:membrane protein implicated in regulation of membrane protease activity
MGRVFQFAWTLAAAFFLLSVLVAAVGFPRWRRRERADAAETVRTLRLLKTDSSIDHRWDA